MRRHLFAQDNVYRGKGTMTGRFWASKRDGQHGSKVGKPREQLIGWPSVRVLAPKPGPMDEVQVTEKEGLQTNLWELKDLEKMGYMQSCLGAKQQTITCGRESETSSHLCTHYPALLRFEKATGASETVQWILEWAKEPMPSRCCLLCLEGEDFGVDTWENDKSVIKLFCFCLFKSWGLPELVWEWLLQGAGGSYTTREKWPSSKV